MSQPESILRREANLPDGPAAAAILLQPLLAEAAGADAQAVSLTLDYGVAAAAGATMALEAWVDRATRTLVFAHGRLLTPAGDVAASGSAVFRRVT
jgi:hypothetical protein